MSPMLKSLLLVDGYNVLHALPRYRKLLWQDRANARSRLIDDLRAVHDHLEWEVCTVFDGTGQTISIERPDARETFTVVYAPADASADGVIERMALRADNPSRICAVTGDRAIQLALHAVGATTRDPSDLADLADLFTDASSRARKRVATIRREAAWDNPLPFPDEP